MESNELALIIYSLWENESNALTYKQIINELMFSGYNTKQYNQLKKQLKQMFRRYLPPKLYKHYVGKN